MTLKVLRPVVPLFFALVPFMASWACGGSDSGNGTPPPANTTPDAASTGTQPPPPPPPPVDAGNPVDSGGGGLDAPADNYNGDSGFSTTYPAPHPPFPTVSNNGGPVLTAPNIVTITFPTQLGASAVTDYETFDDTITTTPWWSTVMAGYCSPEGSKNCVGPGTSGGHVELTETAPTALTDTQQAGSANTMWTFIQDHVTNGGASGASGTFPPPTANTIYAIYFPSSTTITYGGSQSCSSFGGYHGALPVTPAGGGAAVNVAYAVLPDCGSGFDIHVAASHEFAEAASDPGTDPRNGLTYFMTDPGYLILNGDLGEIGDVCVGNNTTQGSYTVQRIWNNVEALASSSPCAPYTGTYFNTAVETQVTVLAVGQSTTLTLTGYSNQATPDWNVQALDLQQANGGTALTQLSIDKSTLNNGETATLTVKLLAKPPADPILGGDYAVFFISSTNTTNPNDGHGWAAAIQGP